MPVYSNAQLPDLACCQMNVQANVWFDTPYFGKHYDDALMQPNARYRPGDTATIDFVTGHPKNNLRDEDTFLRIFYIRPDADFAPAQVVTTDNDWGNPIPLAHPNEYKAWTLLRRA